MKPFLDFFAVVVFVAVYFVGGWLAGPSHDLAVVLLGEVVQGGAIPPDLAPLMLATAAAIVVILIQIVASVLMRHRITAMQWTTFVVFLTLGSATIYFHNEVFIKVKPTVLYWLLALVFASSNAFLGKNLIQSMLEPAGVRMDRQHWTRLSHAWVAFFAIVGCINLYVAFQMSRDFWVSFKLFGITGLTIAFAVVQSLFLGRFIEDGPAKVQPPATHD